MAFNPYDPYNTYNPYDDEEDEDQQSPILQLEEEVDPEEQELLNIAQQAPAAVEPPPPSPTTPPVTTPTPQIKSWADEPITTEPSTGGAWANMLKDLEAKGMWGEEKYGKPIGQGDVVIGGGIKAGSPGYIQSSTTTSSRAVSPAQVAGRTTLPDKMDTSSRQANISQWAPVLQDLEKRTGLSAEAVGAIIIAENGGGESDISANGNNYFSIHFANLPGQLGPYKDTLAAQYKNAQESLNSFVDLISTSDRYAKAWAVRDDPEKFFSALIDAGYIEPGEAGRANWLKNLRSGREQYKEIASLNSAGTAMGSPTGTRELVGITPSQAAYARDVDPTDGWSLCGPIAGVGLAASLGVNVSIEEAKAAAAKHGWTSDAGMAGPRSYVAMLNDLGIKSEYKSGIDWDVIRQEVQAGKVVTLNAPTTGGKIGHYFNVEGYDPTTGKFYLGNSLLSLNNNIHGGNAWVTPEELAAMQARTTLNMEPDGMIIAAGSGAARPGTSAPRQQQTTTTYTKTPETPLEVPKEIIRANVGNRPVTMWDIALGRWESPVAEPMKAPPPPSVEAPRSATPAQQPAYLQRGAQDARAMQQAKPQAATTQQVQPEKDALAQWEAALPTYFEQVQEISRQNAQRELEYRQAVAAQAESGQSPLEAGVIERPVPTPIPPPPDLPSTPLTDAAITAENNKRLKEWQDNGAKGPAPETVRTMGAIRAEIQAKAAEADAGAIQQTADNVLWAYAQNYNQRIAESQRIQNEISSIRGLNAVMVRPVMEETRFLEENQAGPGDASVSVESGIVAPEGPVPVVPRTTKVYSRAEEIDAAPEMPGYLDPEQNKGLANRVSLGYNLPSEKLVREQAAAEGVNVKDPDAIQAWINKEADKYREQGYLGAGEKKTLKAQLAANQAANTDLYYDQQEAQRGTVYMSPELVRSVVEAKYEKPLEETTKKERTSVIREYQEANRPITYETQTLLGRELSILGEGLYDAVKGFSSGLQALGNAVNIPSLEEFGAKQYRNAVEASSGTGSFLGYRTAKVDPTSTNIGEDVIRAVPSLLTSIGVSVPTVLIAQAVGAPAGIAAGVGVVASSLATFLQEGGSAYADAKKARATDSQATATFLSTGAINAALEAIPVGKAKKYVPGLEPLLTKLGNSYAAKIIPALATRLEATPAGRKLVALGSDIGAPALKNFFTEGGQELLQEASSIANQSWYKDVDVQENAAQIVDQFTKAFLVGGLMGAGVEVTMKRARALPNAVWAPLYAATLTERSGTQPDSPSAPTVTPIANPTVGANGAVNAVPVATASTPTAQPQPSGGYVQGTNQRLYNPRVNPDTGGFQTNASPEFEQNLIDNHPVPQTYYEGTANVGEQTAAASNAMQRIQEDQKRQLTPDERSAVLNHYGINDATQAHIASIGAYHAGQTPQDAGSVQQAIRSVYSGTQPPTIEQFTAAVESNANARRAQQPQPAQGQAAVFDSQGNAVTTAPPEARGNLPVAAEAVDINAPVTPGRGDAQIIQPGQLAPDAQAILNQYENRAAQPTPAAPPAQPAAPQAPSQAQAPTTTPRGGKKKAPATGTGQKPQRIPVGTSVKPQETPPPPVPQAPTVAPNTVMSTSSVPEGVRVVDGTEQVAPKPSKDSPVGRIKAAIKKLNPEDAQVFNGILSDERKEKGSPLTVAEAIQVLEGHFEGEPEVVSKILDEAGIDAVSLGDGNTRILRGQAPTPPAKKNRNKKEKTRIVYVPLQTKSRYSPEMKNAMENGIDPAQGQDAFMVSENPADFMAEERTLPVPIEVKESDIKTAPDGSLYIESPGGKYTPVASGNKVKKAGAPEGKTRVPRDHKESADKLDFVNRSPIEGTDRRMLFQDGEVDAATRNEVSNRGYVKTLDGIFSNMFNAIRDIHNKNWPKRVPTDSGYFGLAWMPNVLGVTLGRVQTATGATVDGKVFMDIHSHFASVQRLASLVGVKVGSPEFRMMLAKAFVETMVHEVAHTLQTTQVDASGHGGQHSIAILEAWRTDKATLDGLVGDVYRALTPEVVSQIEQDTTTLEGTVGKTLTLDQITGEAPAQEATAVPEAERNPPVAEPESILTPEEAQEVDEAKIQENRQGLRIADGNQSITIGRPGGRMLQRVRSAIMDWKMVQDPATQRWDRTVGDKLLIEFTKALKLEKIQRGVPGKFRATPTVKNVFDALFAIMPDEDVDAIAKRVGVDGYSYTDINNKKQTIIFPHAEKGQQNGQKQRTDDADRGVDTNRLRSEEGRSGRPRSNNERSNRERVSSTPRDLRDGSGVVSTGTFVPGTPNANGGVDGFQRPTFTTDGGRVLRTGPAFDANGELRDDAEVREHVVTKYLQGTTEPSRGKFWSKSQGKYLDFVSSIEFRMMNYLESLVSDKGPKGIVEWANESDMDGRPLTLSYITADGKHSTYNPDFMIVYNDGTIEVLETKGSIYLIRDGESLSRDQKKLSPGKVIPKIIAMLTARTPGQNWSYRIVSHTDPYITGKQPTRQQERDIIAFYEKVSELFRTLPILEDPVLAYGQARAAITKIQAETYKPTYGPIRPGVTAAFIAIPQTATSFIQDLDAFVKNAGRRVNAVVRDTNLQINKVLQGASYSKNRKGLSLTMTGDIDAGILAAAEIVNLDPALQNNHTILFEESASGDAALHSFEFSGTDDVITTGLEEALEDSRVVPRIHLAYDEDGFVKEVTIASITNSGQRIPENDFLDIRDKIANVFHNYGIALENHKTTRGYFVDIQKLGAENVIESRRRRVTGQPLGTANRIENRPVDRDERTSNPIPQWTAPGEVETARVRSDEDTGEIPRLRQAGPPIGGIITPQQRAAAAAAAAARMQQNAANAAGRIGPAQQRAQAAAQRAAFMQQRAAWIAANPGKPLPANLRIPRPARPAQNPTQAAAAAAQRAQQAAVNAQAQVGRAQQVAANAQQRAVAAQQRAQNAAVIPNLDLKKFSKEAQGIIRASAQAVMAAGGPPADTRQTAMRHLGFKSVQQFNNSPASNLSDIELAALNLAIDTARTNMDAQARAISTQTTPVTEEQLRDFIQTGLRFQALHAQLTGDKGAIRQGSRLYTQARQNTAKGESVQQHINRILGYARTNKGKASGFAKKFIESFHNANVLGANSNQIAKAWEGILNPRTNVGDWMVGLTYSALLGPTTAIVAAVTNVAEIAWRAVRDLGMTPLQYIHDPASAGKILVAEGMGFLYGALQGVGAFFEVLLHGATHQQIALMDVPHHRLQNNNLGILSKPANLLGTAVETFWGRFFTGADAFAKTWAYSMQMGREAAIYARKVSPNGNFTMRDVSHWYNNPTTEMMDKAQRVALETVFQGEMGKAGEVMANVQNFAGVGRILFPFLRTIYHGMARSVDRSPIGMVGAIFDAMRTAPGRNFFQKTRNITQSPYFKGQPTKELQAVRPIGERMIDSVMGTAVTYGLYQAVVAGLIELTGAPPDDQEEKDQWQREGKTPYSISFGGGPWRTYQNWGPANLALAFIAELHKANKRNDITPFNAYGFAAKNIAGAFIDMSFLSTMVNILGSPDGGRGDNILATNFGRQAENLFMSRIPFAATLRGYARSGDTYVRFPDEKTDLAQRLAEDFSSLMPLNIPFSETPLAVEVAGMPLNRRILLPTLDVWGFPVPNTSAGWNAWNPFRASERKIDPVDNEIKRLVEAGVENIAPNRAPTTYKDYKFTDAELFEWRRRVGQDSYNRVLHLMGTQTYKDAPDTGAPVTKSSLIEAQYKAAQETAWESLALTVPTKDPGRKPKYYGIEAEAVKRGLDWPTFEKDIDEAKSKWADYRDALKNGRKPPVLTPAEIQLATIYSNPAMINKAYQLERDKAQQTKKRADDEYPGIPFTALP